jgi:hypothetical protein
MPDYRNTGAAMRYIEVLSDPQGLRLLSKRPCQHSSCSWAKASKPMKIKAARIHPATTFFTMTATPRGLAHDVVGDDGQDDDRHGRGRQCAARPIEPCRPDRNKAAMSLLGPLRRHHDVRCPAAVGGRADSPPRRSHRRLVLGNHGKTARWRADSRTLGRATLR